MTARIAYVVAVLFALWSFAGGHLELFWQRLPVFSLVLFVIAALSVAAKIFVLKKRLESQSLDAGSTFVWSDIFIYLAHVDVHPGEVSAYPETPIKKNFINGTLAALVVSIPVIVFIVLAHKTEIIPLSASNDLKSLSANIDFKICLLGLFVLGPAWALLSRGVFQSDWNLTSIAFLDAFTIGFGLQMLSPFVIFWLLGLAWGWIARRQGVLAAVVAQSLGLFLILLSLQLSR